MTSQKLTILILEDTPADADLISGVLRDAKLEFTAVQVAHERDFQQLIRKVSPDLIVADHALVGPNGESALAASRVLHPSVPFIIVSDTPGEEFAVEAVRRGATDYILKTRLGRLGSVVQRALGKKEYPGAEEVRLPLRGPDPSLTERKGDSERLRDLSRLLRAAREINKVIVRERESEILLSRACDILVRTRGYLHVGVGLVASRFRSVAPVAKSLRRMPFLDAFSITWAGDADADLPARATIHSGRSWLCQDTAADPRFENWRHGALESGCASLAVVPMIHWGQVVGAITICSERAGTFHAEEVRQLEELAENIAFALECIRREHAYRNAEAHLHLLNSALRSAANAIVITDRAGMVQWTNPAFSELTGYTVEEIRGRSTSLLKSGVHDTSFYRRLWETILSGAVWRSEMVNRRKDGTLYTEECTITPVRNEEGEVQHFIAVKQDITERKNAEEQLRASMDRLLKQEATLLALTKAMLMPGNNLPSALRMLTESAARSLGVARVSLWRYERGEQLLHCIDLYELDAGRHSDGAELWAADYPVYFRALAESDVVATDNAFSDPSTAEFSTSYLKPNGISSMMDVPIRLRGSLRAVLCHEHVGEKRRWTSDERTFAISIANLVALVLEEAERKQAQEELRASQLAYASLVNTVEGIVWEVDVPTFRFTFVSQQAERLLGYPVSRWIREPDFWEKHLHPEDRDQAISLCRTATAEMRDHDFKYRMIAADGRPVWLHDIVAVIVEDNQPAKLRGIMVDITQSKLAEEALRWRTAFFEALVDASLDGILVVDSEGKKLFQNNRMNELWGVPPEIANDTDDRRQIDFVKSRTRNPQQFVEKVAHLYAHNNEVNRSEIELVNGTVLDRYTAPVRDKHGTYYGRIWTFRDITEQRRLESQVRQSQKMEAVGQLAGGVAHDFNNILTAVLMHLGILRTTLHEPETVEALKDLEAQARRAADLTRQLLMFSRKSAIEVKPTDLNCVVEEMLKMLRRLLGEHVQVDFRGAHGLPMIDADRGMMQQVIMNLAVNGRDAMPEGGLLTILTRKMEFDGGLATGDSDRRPGTYVQLSVIDTGCGMDENTRRRIFEPFFTTKELGKGTGLGLATVYGIVQQHHGWIEVESQPGKGSRFDVFLPISERTGTVTASETSFTMRGGNETILLVEDEAMVRLATARRLQMLGYRVIEAPDGKSAQQLWSAHSHEVDLLFTDMIMPHKISGLELARCFRKERPGLKVIITSGYSAEISAHGIPSAPGIHYLPKPFETLNLASVVRSCLDQK